MQITTRPQKILLVITKSNWGGAQKYVYTLAINAAKEPHFRVEILTGNRGELNERLKAAGIKERSLRIKNSLDPFVFLGEVINVIGVLKESKPDIVHSNSNKAGIVYGLATGLYNLTHREKIRSIFTVHGHAFNEDRNILSKLYITIAELVIFILADKIICVSKKTLRDIPFKILFKRKTEVIYNGLPEYQYLDRDMARESLGIEDNSAPQIVTIGELNDTKNHTYLLRALSECKKPFHYHIIGTGIKENEIRKFMYEHMLDGKVTLHGHVVDAYKYLKAFDLFILPSKTEALAYVIQEACQAGVPTIASHVGGLPELLPKDHLFRLDHPEELKSLLEKIDSIPPHNHYFKEEDMLKETFELYRK